MHLPAAIMFRSHSRQIVYGAALGVAMLAGCSDGPTGPRPLPVTVSGSVTNRSGAAIPPNARVVVMWATDDEGAYIFGEGTLDRTTNRFTITFDEDVPRAALLGDMLGVGFVMLTTDQSLGEGPVPDGYDYSATVIGATGQHAIIYLNDEPSRFAPDWPSDFRRGYNVGVGRDLPVPSTASHRRG